MKKIVMMVGMITAALGAWAYETWTDPETGIVWKYTVSDGKASVGIGENGSPAVPRATDGAITIPSTIGGYPVTSIGSWAFAYCSGLTSVTIPSSVTNIGKSAFRDCNGLTSVTIPSGVTSIGSWAFAYCRGLTSVTIPSSVTSIGNYVFYQCSCLTSVTIPSSVTSIGNYVFYQCSCLTSVTIPSSVTSIDSSAFYGCSGLGEGVVIVDGCVLTVNGDCPSVIELPTGVRLIACGAFADCCGLTSVTIPSSVMSISEDAFANCSGLRSVKIPSSVTGIGDFAFCDCSGLTSITIPRSVTSIGECAFSDCSGLTSITIPRSVTSIGECAFDGCSNLTKVYVDAGDADRVSALLDDCAGIDVSKIEFVVGLGSFTGAKAMVFNGLVYDADGVVCGIVQVTTGKATKKGVKVGGFVMLEDGKKQTIKSSTVAIQDGYVKVSTKVVKLGTAAITVGGDGFEGTLGNMTLASAATDENTGILSGTLKMSYFDAKTGKIKTKSIKIGGVTADGEAVGSATIKGQTTKSFSAEVE